MSDETPQNHDELKRRPRNTPSGELPASLIFTELVRQAAARKAAQNEDTPDIPAPKSSIPQFFEEDDLPPQTQERPPSATRRPPPEALKPRQPAGGTPPHGEPEGNRPAEAAAPTAKNPPPVAQIIPEPQVPAPTYTHAAARALTDEERKGAVALEAERIRRVKKRQSVRHARRVGVLGGVIRALLVVSFAAGLMATILSWFTSPEFLQPEMRRNLSVVLYSDRPTPTPTVAPTPNWARTIGIVSGHRGPGQFAAYDPGATCPDSDITENDINFAVASQVVLALRQRGYSVLLLDEFDARLNDFQAAALVSIHSNDCRDYGEVVSGFLVAKAAAKPTGGPDDQLAECIGTLYGPISGLGRRFGTTIHMTDYHSFREIHPLTPAAIVELGFLRADRDALTNRQDLLARGVVEGILCFLEPDNPFGILPATPEPSPTAVPDA